MNKIEAEIMLTKGWATGGLQFTHLTIRPPSVKINFFNLKSTLSIT